MGLLFVEGFLEHIVNCLATQSNQWKLTFSDRLSPLLVERGPGLLIVVPKQPSSSVASEAVMRTDAPNREKRDGASTCSRRGHGPCISVSPPLHCRKPHAVPP
jgi:hypothetical protein